MTGTATGTGPVVTQVGEDRAIWTLTITNPAKRNALDDATRRALLDALSIAMAAPDCRVVVLTGAGATFCAGGDLPSMPSDDRSITVRLAELHRILELIIRGPRPVVAAVEGAAFGSGLSMAAASDLVVAASDARFGAPFTKVGVAPDVGLLWTLPRRVGLGPARRIALLAREVPAVQAERLGIVDELVPPGAALAGAQALAAELAARAPLALAATKRLLLAGGADLDSLLQAESDEQRTLLSTRDFREGRAAFFDRRPPRFTET